VGLGNVVSVEGSCEFGGASVDGLLGVNSSINDALLWVVEGEVLEAFLEATFIDADEAGCGSDAEVFADCCDRVGWGSSLVVETVTA